VAGSGTAHLRDGDDPLLRVENLVVNFAGAGGRTVHAVSDVSFDLMEGETLGLVGESGCGKSTTGKAVLQVPRPTSGSIRLDDVELTELAAEDMRLTRPTLQMIFQDPISSLNPRRSIRDVVAEPRYIWWEEEEGRPPTSVWFEKLGAVFQRIANTVLRPVRFVMPFAALAMVLWIVSEAVEDRSWEDALEWTQVPAQIIGFPVLAILLLVVGSLLVLGVIWLLAAVLVPFGVVGRLVGDVSPTAGILGVVFALAMAVFQFVVTRDSFGALAHWAWTTVILLACVVLLIWLIASLQDPSRAGAAGLAAALATFVLIQARYVASQDGTIWGDADDGFLGLGPERPGKLLVLVVAVLIDLWLFRFIKGKLIQQRDERRARVEPEVRKVLETVGINPDNALDRKPYEFSGGQAQRISIARALIMNPKVIICDEPVSALDVSVQAQILNLLEEMKEEYGLTLVFIAHDLAVVKNVSDRVAVMYLGKLCEVGDPDRLYEAPAHPYTNLLLSAIPHPDPEVDPMGLDRLDGELPSPMDPPSGCRFRTRCPRASDRCAEEEPQMREVYGGQYVACHFPLVGEEAR